MIRFNCTGFAIGILTLVFAVLVPWASIWAQQTPKTVLILNSYHKAEWTDSLLDGIGSELGKIADVDLVIEYMDTKRINTKAYYQALDNIYKMKYSQTPFDVILTSDDNAYRFALDRQANFFKQAPIVFCGVNRFDQREIEDKPMVTGVVEKGDFKDTLAFAMRVRKDASTVHVILDHTPTGQINKDAFLSVLNRQIPKLDVAFLTDISLNDLAKKLAALPSSDFAFFISFWEDDRGKPISPDNLSTAFYQSSVPIFGRSEWMLNKGMTGGKCVSGFHQGKAAAHLVKRILMGENPAAIPVNRNSPNRFMFDYLLLERYGIDPSVLPTDSILFNKPKPTFYVIYRRLIWSVAAVLVVLIGLVISLALNVTIRRRAEIALRESEEKYRRIFENSVVGFFQSTLGGRFITVNPAFAKMLLYDSPEDLVASISDIATQYYVNPKDREKYQNIVRKHGKVDGFEIQVQRKDRSIIWVSNATRAYFNEEGQILHYEGLVNDITDRKQAEKVVLESNEIKARFKKMESLGLLAGGVAHDLNNILSGIVSYPDLLLSDLPKDSSLRKPIETMKNSGERAAAIVQDLLTMARGVATNKEPLNLNTLIREYLDSPEFENLKQRNQPIEIEVNLDKNLFSIYGSQIHIRKVVMNLISNAAEAIDIKGKISIFTANCYVDKPFRGYDEFNEGEYIVLSVADNGSGISDDDINRIFEPFYTKKVMGRSGTGLGLAVVWNIVQDHKGYIDLVNEKNNTTFSLYFPATRELISESDSQRAIEEYQGNEETILIVDDIESQRNIVRSMLKKLGYSPRSVSSGEEAVEYVKQHEVDLIILDMIMDPGINGSVTYERILKIKPRQRAIIASGFAETDEVKRAQQLGAGKYLKKPFTMEQLGLAVVEALRS